MVRIFGLCLVFVIAVYGANFETECASCHSKGGPELENIYFRYLQVHGSQKRAKDKMRAYLLAPSIEKSIMPQQALLKFGIHQPVDQNIVDEMLDCYFEQYDVKKRIKLL